MTGVSIMDDIKRAPDRLNITKKANAIIAKIDQEKYFGLQNNCISRSELFLFMMALGLSVRTPTRLENTHPGGLILASSLSSRTQSLMYALFISTLSGEDIDRVTQKDLVYEMAQQYANTGFEIIEDEMNKMTDKKLMWDVIQELDNKYDELFPDENTIES